MKFAFLFVGLLLLILGLGCMPAPPIQEDQREALVEVERDFDPLAQDRERPIVIAEREEGLGQVSVPQRGQKVGGSQETPMSPVKAGVIKGYRVQIFLSDNLREAARVMAGAREEFEEEVYLEYDAPYYKVRVGDCQTEAEGQHLLKVARSLGYGDAWLVFAVISVPEEQTP